MSVPAHSLQLSIDEYLDLEAASDVRHEYVGGRMFAMAGATQAHDAIVINLTVLIGSKIQASGCRLFSADMKIRVEATHSVYYPDLMVSCEPYSAKSIFAKAPCLVVEVLSPSSIDVDRREKLLSYRTLTSLQEYLIVYQSERKVELYKQVGEDWTGYVYTGDDVFELNPAPNLEVAISLDQLYAGVFDQN
jgi:Uma2 family endonuclease